MSDSSSQYCFCYITSIFKSSMTSPSHCGIKTKPFSLMVKVFYDISSAFSCSLSSLYSAWQTLTFLCIKWHLHSTFTSLLTVYPHLKFCLFSPLSISSCVAHVSPFSEQPHLGSVPVLSDESCRSGWHLLCLTLLLYSLWLLTCHLFPHFSCFLGYIGSLEARILFFTISMSQDNTLKY